MQPIKNLNLATALFAGLIFRSASPQKTPAFPLKACLAGVLLVLATIFPAAANSAYTWTSTTGGTSITDGAGNWDTTHADWLLKVLARQ